MLTKNPYFTCIKPVFSIVILWCWSTSNPLRRKSKETNKKPTLLIHRLAAGSWRFRWQQRRCHGNLVVVGVGVQVQYRGYVGSVAVQCRSGWVQACISKLGLVIVMQGGGRGGGGRQRYGYCIEFLLHIHTPMSQHCEQCGGLRLGLLWTIDDCSHHNNNDHNDCLRRLYDVYNAYATASSTPSLQRQRFTPAAA